MSVPAETVRNQSAAQSAVVVDDEISLSELLKILWRGKWVILACVAVALGLALNHLANSEPAYRVSYVVSPVDGGGGGGGGLPSGARQAADFAGISLPSSDGGTPRIIKYKNALTSLTVAQRLANNHGMLPRVFNDRWNADSQSWNLEPGSGPVNWLKAGIKDISGIPTAPRPPDARDLKSYLENNLSVQSGEETSLYTVSLTHTRPEIAEELLNKLNTAADELLRERALARTQRHIAYVQEKLPETTLAAHRDSLTQLLMEQERHLMMAQIDGPYAADIFDPISVSATPVSPQISLVFGAAIVMGGSIGVITVFLWQGLRGGSGRDRSKQKAPAGKQPTASTPNERD